MSFFDAAILALVEGITEFLPISSTGHLILAGKILGAAQTEFVASFDIAIQLGAVMAVIVLYWRKFILDFGMIKKVVIAFIPTGIVGLIFYKFIKGKLMSSEATVLWALFLGGIFLIIFELFFSKRDTGDNNGITYGRAFGVGLAQSVSVIPGVSRAAATIVGGRSLGIGKKEIVEFSFFLAVPTMLAATVLDLAKNYQSFSSNDFWIMAVGFVLAFITALISIKFLLKFIENHSFIGFGVYRIIVAVLFWFLVLK